MTFKVVRRTDVGGRPASFWYSEQSAYVACGQMASGATEWSPDNPVTYNEETFDWAVVRDEALRVGAPLPPPASPAPLSDLKEGLSSARKADTTHMRTPFLVYGSRACEYGSAKYERANYLRPTGSVKKDFERLRAYLRAAESHIRTVLDAMELHQAQDPQLTDEAGMREAAYCKDTDTKPGDKVGPSGLPHLCGAVASLNMAITQAATYGLLPADPGQPWSAK
jgi:hypothetical protein